MNPTYCKVLCMPAKAEVNKQEVWVQLWFDDEGLEIPEMHSVRSLN